MSTLAVVGSRSLSHNTDAKRKAMGILTRGLAAHPEITTVVSGGAHGPDRWGQLVAYENNLSFKLHKPDWNHHGRKAGFIRNELIVQDADLLIAFWDGLSAGTQHDIELCKKYAVPHHIFVWDGRTYHKFRPYDDPED